MVEALVLGIRGLASILTAVNEPGVKEVLKRNRRVIVFLLLIGACGLIWKSSLLKNVTLLSGSEAEIVKAAREGRPVVVLPESERSLFNAVQEGRRTASAHPFMAALLEERLTLIDRMFGKPGIVRVPASELGSVALSMMDHIQVGMVATSTDVTWWDDKFGAKYQDKNTSLANFKPILRIFQYESDQELVRLRPILVEQKRANISVFTAKLDMSAPLDDYVVIDNVIAGRLELSIDRRPRYAEFTIDKGEVAAINARIEQIKQHMRPFKE